MGAFAEEATDAVTISRKGLWHPQHARLYRLSLNDPFPLRNIETPPQATAVQERPRQFPSPVSARCACTSISARPDSWTLQSLTTFEHPTVLLQSPAASLPLHHGPSLASAFRRLAHRTPPSARESHAASPLLCTLACHTLSPPSVLCALIYRIT
jgi:hypothetical protein